MTYFRRPARGRAYPRGRMLASQGGAAGAAASILDFVLN